VDEHIGVISPYQAQCSKIKMVLSKIAKGIKVGSVEEFQGQERRVIIVSSVRSNLEFVQSDINHTLGFVANPRRFNGQ
jgi:helicase MOV-10